jgi:acyl dehydratase
MTGKFNQLGYWNGSVMAMLENGWSFYGPVRPGDTVHSKLTIGELVESKTRDKGAIKIYFDICNQRGETVIKGFLKLLLRKRP